MITIVIADDHPMARVGIRNLLSSDPELIIVGEAEDGAEAQQLIEKLHPHVLLLDLKMPGLRAAEVERWVRTHHPDTVTLVLTAHDRDAYLAEMISAGVSGYFSKSVRGDQLIGAIHRAVDGEFLITELQKMRVKRWRERISDKNDSLTEREREILILLCQGFTNIHIAEKLGISNRTIAFHISNILKKLGVDSRQKAITWAYQNLGDDLEFRQE